MVFYNAFLFPYVSMFLSGLVGVLWDWHLGFQWFQWCMPCWESTERGARTVHLWIFCHKVGLNESTLVRTDRTDIHTKQLDFSSKTPHSWSSETDWFLALGLPTTKALASPKSANFKRISLSIRRFWGLNFSGLTREISMLQNRWVFSPEGFRAKGSRTWCLYEWCAWPQRCSSFLIVFLLKNWVMFVLSPKLPGNSGAPHFFCEYVWRYMDIYCIYIYMCLCICKYIHIYNYTYTYMC